MASKESSRNLNAKEAVELLRGNLSNGDLMQKFRVSPKGFADLLTQLFEKKLITEQDLQRRGIRFKVKKQQSSPEPVTATLPPAPQPMPDGDQDEEFLDTVALTDLLSGFKPPEPSPPSEAQSMEIQGPEDLKIDETKKSRFRLSNFFKKPS